MTTLLLSRDVSLYSSSEGMQTMMLQLHSDCHTCNPLNDETCRSASLLLHALPPCHVATLTTLIVLQIRWALMQTSPLVAGGGGSWISLSRYVTGHATARVRDFDPAARVKR